MSEIDNLTIEQKQDILNKILEERERHRINYKKRVEQGIKYNKKMVQILIHKNRIGKK